MRRAGKRGSATGNRCLPRLLFLCALLLGAASLASCATILNEKIKAVTFTSLPQGAKIRLISFDEEKQYVFEAPETINLHEDKKYFATYSMAGFHVQSVPVSSETGDGGAAVMSAGNLIVGGVPGIIIDVASGSLTTFPSEIALEMTRLEDEAPLNALSSEDVLEKIHILSEANKAKDERIRAANKRRRVKTLYVPTKYGDASTIGVCEIFECVEEITGQCRNKKIDRACRQRSTSPASSN
jgi:hypothetical protein